MKKYILTIIAALGVFFIPNVKAASKVELPEKTDHEKVKIYLFWWTKCGHCHDLISYFSDKYIDYTDYFEFVTYESTAAENGKLISSMSEYFEDYKGGVPLIVIGDQFHQAGFGNDGTNIIEAALKEYQNDNYKDIVAEAIAKNGFKLEAQTFYSACKTMGIKCKESAEESGISDAVVIGIIFGVIVLGFGGLVLYSRKK